MGTLEETRKNPPCSKSHPFLTFALDLTRIHRSTWMRLGEAASKVEHIASTPLPPTVKRELQLIYLTRGVQATTAIEGNTLTEEQVRMAVEGQLMLPLSQQYLQQEVENILSACNEVAATIRRGEQFPLTRETFSRFNQITLDRLALEKDVAPDEIRSHPVVVGNVYRAVPYECCSELLDALVEWLGHEEWNRIADTTGPWRTAIALLRALVAHLYIAWIHPFGDGNGRTARLIELTVLANAGVPLPAAHLLSSFFNKTRNEYYRQLSLAAQQPNDVSSFIQYAVDGFVDGLTDQLSLVDGWVGALAWSKTVRDALNDQNVGDEVRDRRAKLADALAENPLGIPRGRIAIFNPDISTLYAGKTTKTASRDLNALRELDLVTITGNIVTANVELLSQLLPSRALLN